VFPKKKEKGMLMMFQWHLHSPSKIYVQEASPKERIQVQEVSLKKKKEKER
jgi:hypothetical protein